MKNQLYFRLFCYISILGILVGAVATPTGVVHAASSVTISGSVGAAGAGATITANGNSGYDDSTATADGSGNYSVTVDTSWFFQRWSGTVTPSKAGYTFSPSSRTYSGITSNQTGQNYTATPSTYTISGSVGSAGGGATITYTGGSTTANSSGSYSFTVAYGWSGTVTPTKTGYTFSPANRGYTNVTSNQTNQNYTATLNGYTLSGNVGSGSVTITYTGGSTTSNSSGDYSFIVLPGWSGTVTPSRTGFAFWPASRTYTNVTANQSAQDYTPRPTSFTFGSMADAHAEPYFPYVADELSSLNPALVLFNGDVENDGFLASQMNSVVSVLKNENLFNKTFMIRGNHDNIVEGSAALWENYLETSPNIPTRPAYVANKVSLNSSSDNLTYSFDYGNSIFIGLDVPGDIYLLSQAEVDFLDARLTYAENAGLTHAFIFFHGPEYCVEQEHCTSSARDDSSSTPPALINVINNHPIVSATFHGHEHVLTWTHMDNTRVSALTRSYEQFVTSPSGASSYSSIIYPDRVDYAYTDMLEDDLAFATVSVNGLSFTVNFYKQGTPQPVWTHAFSKINTPPTISDITDKTTNEDTATGAIPFTVGDMELNPDYLTVTAASSDLTLVPPGNISLGGSGANRTIDILPAPNQSGTATITVSVNDGNVTVNDTFVLMVTAVNDAPVADAQSITMPWNTSMNIVLTGSDVEESPLTFSIVADPAHGSLSGSGANQTYTSTAGYSGTDSFTFKANDGELDSAPATVSINVTAYTISGNAGVAGATLSYTAGTSKTVTADGTGNYSFQVPIDWSGTVTPSKAGYNFSPASMTYTNVQADQAAQNYSVSGVMITISGYAGVAGATLSYTDGTLKTVTADDAGLYLIEVPYNWSGTVTPSKSGYGFRPASRAYANVISNRDSQDFITTTSRVYYVDKTNAACTDVGTVGSMALPFCTIGRGAYLAQPGQIVQVLHGTYAETVYPERSGTEGNPITYWADPGVVVTGKPYAPPVPPSTTGTNYPGFGLSGKSYIKIDGFTFDSTSQQGIYVDASDHITITNNHITRAGISSPPLPEGHPYTQGIYTRNTSYSEISNNITDYNTCIGIRLVGGDHNLISRNISYENFSLVETDAAGIELTGSSYNTIINNLVYSNEDSGINLYYWDGHGGSTNNLVIGNLSYENGDHGIDNYQSPNNTIVGNTVQGNGTVGINFEGNTAPLGSFGAIVANNIMSENGTTPPSGSWGGNLRFDANSITGSSTDYNLFYRTDATVQIIWNNINYTSLAAFKTAVSGQEVYGLEGNPLFVNPVAPVHRQTGVPYNGLGIFGNYYTSVGSPAIDSANADAPSEQSTDIAGNSRIDDPATPNTGAGVRTYDDRGAYEYLPAGPSLPVVTTQAVSAITQTSAIGNGNLTAPGLPNPTEHGIVWSTSPNPTTDDSKTTDGPLSETGPFTSSLTGLTPGTLYHVRAYATNDVGTVYGEDVTFTAFLMPNVTTQPVTTITQTTATGNGNVTALGIPNPTQHGMVWSTSLNPTTADNKTTDGPVSATGAFTSSLTGLTPGTLYHVRAYVTNAAGTAYGSDFTFTTLIAPTVTTQAVTAITTTTATGNGSVTALGIPNPTQHGMVWSTSLNPTTADNKTTDGPVSATGAFTSSLTGLTPGTLYHVRAYATNAAGTSYGSDVTFTALLLPTVTTQAVTGITTTTATGNGNITVLGIPNPTEHGMVWSTSLNPTTADNKTTDGPVSATGTFISSLTGLTPGTLYHVRAYATNDAGTVYGGDVTFRALITPTVTTQAVTAITTTTATGNGNVTNLGVPNPTEHGMVWSTSLDPTTADNKTTDGPVSATGAFTSSLTGLTPGTLYHVRAYATNDVGTVYGEDVTFTALLVPAVTTQAVTAITTTSATGNGNVTALGIPNPTQHGMVWSTSLNPTTADNKTTDGPVSATGAFTSSLTGLTPGTLYHVRAYVTNAGGTVYGEDVTFTTLLTPTVTTQAVTDIAQTTATGNGNITVLGSSNPTEHGMVWSTSLNPTTADNKTTDGPVSATGAFTSSLTGLTPGTLYHVRAYATNAAGTSYGSDVTFTALLLPTVTTQAVTDITQTTATGNGNITALGIPNPTQHGIVWSTSPNPTTADNKTTDGPVSVTGAFTSNMTGLAIGMQYHVRAYATNAAGTVYGTDVVFTTVSSSTGTTTPHTNAGAGSDVSGTGTASWLNPGYIIGDDTNYAQVTVNNATSHYLEGTNYGFAIPANATINGIVVTIGRYESGSGSGNDVRDSVVSLLKNGVVTGSNKAATSMEWPVTTPVDAVYGTTADLWGTTWTASDINNSAFGVALSVNSANNRTAFVDYMQVSITYTVSVVGSVTSVNCGSGTPIADYGSSITCIATVVRGSGSFTPTGNVTWTSNGSGNFVTSPCVLSGSNGTASCSVSYTPTSVGNGLHQIAAAYAGDISFYASSGNQTLTVNKIAASVMPNAASKTYGEADPALTGTLTGFLPADSVTATYSRAAGETVEGSPYTISATLSPAGVLGNYNVTYNTAPFIIGKKDASVTPNPASKYLGEADPALTGTLTGFLPADSVAATYSRAAGETVEGSPYTISATLSPAGVLGNYNVMYNTADFIILPLPEYTLTINKIGNGTVTAAPSQPTYHDGDVVTLTATPDEDWSFSGWSENVVDGQVTIQGNTAVTATFLMNNIAPSFTSTPVVSVAEDAVYTYDITATDPNVGDTLAITAPTKPAWLTLTDNGNGSAVLTGTPTNTEVGSHEVVLRASDGILTTDQSFSIEVVNTNDPPSFTSTPVTDAQEDAVYTYTITTSDPDVGATLAITAPILPAWLTLTDNGDGTAILTGTPTNGDVGINHVALRVNDGTVDVDQTFTIDVGNTNDGPSFTSTAVTTVNEDEVYTYNITATDPDAGDTLTIAAPTPPAWLTFTDHGNGTATLTGTPTNSEVGDHAVVLQVSDSIELASQSFMITVVNTNDAPVLAQPADQNNVQGAVVSLQLSATDVDAGNTLTYSASDLPAGLSIDPVSGLISGTLTADVNTYNVTVSVEDGQGGTDSKTFNWVVTEPTYTLTINIVGNGTVTKDPDKTAYWNDEQITLAPTPDQGWAFSSWSENVVDGKVTINGNTAVTATFAQIPSGVVLNAPSGTLDNWNNTFSWTGPADAEYYQLEVYDAADTLIVSQWFTNNICSGSACAVSSTETQNLSGGDFKWKVRAYRSSSGYTAWTDFMTFTINATSLNLISPSGTLANWNNTFHWSGISSAEYYHIELRDAASEDLVKDLWFNTNTCIGLNCVVLPAETQNLANGDYKWRMQAYGSTGYTPWTDYVTFTLNAPTLVLNAPTGMLTSWDKTFHWTGIPTAEYYHTQVYDATTDMLVQEEWYTLSICTELDCAVFPAETRNLANGDYKWRVQTYGSTGYTPWTDYVTFTLNAPVLTLVAPSAILTSWNNTFSWTGIPTAEYYHTQVYNATTDTLVQEEWYTLSICTGLDCAISPAETRNLANGDYKWRAQTYGSTGYTPWTDYVTFTLNAPVLTLVAPSATLTSWNNTFSWTGIPTAEYYHTQVYNATTDTLVQEEWYTLSICTGLDCAVSPTETWNLANGDYKWRVQTYGSTGYTPWTDYMTFTLNQ